MFYSRLFCLSPPTLSSRATGLVSFLCQTPYKFKRLLQEKFVIDSFHPRITEMFPQMDKYINTNFD